MRDTYMPNAVTIPCVCAQDRTKYQFFFFWYLHNIQTWVFPISPSGMLSKRNRKVEQDAATYPSSWNTVQRTRHTATQSNTLHDRAAHCNARPPALSTWHCNIEQHPATYPAYCTTTRQSATHCNTLQHTATHCNTLQHTYHSTQHTTLQHTRRLHM